MAILRKVDAEEGLGVASSAEDLGISSLRAPELVQPNRRESGPLLDRHRLAHRRHPDVVKLLRIGRPRHARILRALEFVREVFACVHTTHAKRCLIGVVGLHEIGEQLAVGRRNPAAKRGCAIRGELRRVDEDPLLSALVAPGQEGLLGSLRTPHVKEPALPCDRRRDGVHIEQRREPVCEELVALHIVDDGASMGILAIGPGLHLGRFAIFQPAVGVGDGDAMELVNNGFAPCNGRCGRVLHGGLLRGRTGGQQRGEAEGEGLAHHGCARAASDSAALSRRPSAWMANRCASRGWTGALFGHCHRPKRPRW